VYLGVLQKYDGTTVALSDTFVCLCSTKVGFIILLGTDFLMTKQKPNYFLSAWNRIILEKVIVSQLIFNGNPCFMTSPKEPAICPYTTLSAAL